MLFDRHEKKAFGFPALASLLCLGVDLDAELTFATHVKRVCFYQLRQLWCIRSALSADNVKMLVHALVASRVDYCNSILYQVAAVHLRPLQSVINAVFILSRRRASLSSKSPVTKSLPGHTTVLPTRAFAAADLVLWNSLPSHLKDADLLYSQFRLSLKTFLFQ